MRARGLLPDFSPAVLAEAGAFTGAATVSDATVRDLRGLLWASIDNDDSRDLDQLSVAGAPVEGGEAILVAIADVDALVRKGSAIDNHAAVNTTSVYTAAEIFPMLPEKLSTGLTSLNPAEDRLAVVVDMTVDTDGSIRKSAIYRAAVRNHAKLAYNSTAAWLEGDGPAPASLAAVPGLDEQLHRQSRVAQALKRMRETRGALQLDTLETRAIFSDGTLADLAPDESNRAKELIEDFMVAANGSWPASWQARECRRCAGCCARPCAGTASLRWPRKLARRCPHCPTPLRSTPSCTCVARRTPRASQTSRCRS